MPSLIEIGQLVLEKKIFFFIKFSVFLLFCDYLPLEKGNSQDLYNLESPSPSIWLKLTQWFWRGRQKCKNLQTYGQKDNGQQAIRKTHLSFQLR
jgi:hypothetical protein